MKADMGDLRGAVAILRRAISLCDKESEANPASSEIRGDQGVFNFRLAEMIEKGGDKRGALQYYQKALAIEQAMSDSNPKDLVKRGDVSEDWMKVADLEFEIGDRAAALAGYRKALTIRESMMAAAPDDSDGRSQLALIQQKLGAYYASQAARQSAGKSEENWREAKHWLEKSLAVWNDLQQKKNLGSEYTNNPREVAQLIGRCNRAVALAKN
jgi:tetratricopeptide (TPR) repeat protein